MKTKHFFLLIATILLSLTASADRVKVGDLYYNFVLKAKIASVASCPIDECYSGNIVIPATVEHNGVVCNVTSIEEYAFVHYESNFYGNAQRVSNEELKSVVIPESVKKIGTQAFYLCVNLRSVTLPDGLEEMGSSVFSGCENLTSIKLPETFTTISSGLFSGCKSLVSLDISDNITEIGGNAFSGCKNLPKFNLRNVKAIGNSAFSGCEKLTEIVMSNNLKKIGQLAFDGCSKLSSIVWSDSLKVIDDQAFINCKAITSIDLPHIVSIGSSAFSGCNNLTSVSLGKNLLYIGNRAFSNCTEISDFFIYGRMPDISKDFYVFDNSMIEYSTLHVPAGFINHCRSAETWDGFGNFSPLSEDELGLDAAKCKRIINFADAKVKAICVANWDYNGDGELSEGEAAFPSSLSNMALWDKNGDGEYDDSEKNNAKSSSILKLVFKGNTGIKTFEELQYFIGLNRIEMNTFYNCTSLSKIALPGNITSIDESAFAGCSKLSSVVIPNNVKIIEKNTFSKCSGLTSVLLSNLLTTIGENAFNGCSALTTVSIPNSVSCIGEYAFAYSGLTSIKLSSCLTTLESHTFRGCRNLLSVTIPRGLTKFGDYAIDECQSLDSISIPNTVTSLGRCAFYYCSNLKSITIPGSVTNIEWGVFASCPKLTEIRSFIKEPFPVQLDCDKVTLYVPAGTKELYEETEGWNEFANIIEMESGEDDDNGNVGETDIVINQANFPDAKFREFLLSQSYGKDGILTDDEIKMITKINVSDKGIADLKGIEYFAALTTLDCSKNKLTALDVSKNTKLTQLHCNGNQLPALDVTMNTALKGLWCGSNQISQLDVSKNAALEKLICNNNKLNNLDLSSNEALTTVNCGLNPITSLDLSQNPNLTGLSINRSNIKETAMNTLISSLPTNTTSTPYKLWVINNTNGDEGNECTNAQVAVLKAKGWMAMIYSKVDKDWVEYVVSDKQLHYLVIWAKDGKKATHALKDIIQVKFTDATLVVSKGEHKTYYPLSNMMRFTYDSLMVGDVNGDSQVDVVDIAKTISHISGLTPSEFSEKEADINRDWTIDSDDVTAMAAFVVGGQIPAVPATSQQPIGDAFYIYRNDGGFNAFFRDEVEKMEYSNRDANGNLHDIVVSQLVYTADSIYNIPLEVIDSISFIKPQTKYQNNVVVLGEKYMAYVESSDSLSIQFSKKLPFAMIPHTNDILLFEGTNSMFPNGFAGKVKSYSEGTVLCDSVGLYDVYEELIVLGDYTLLEETGNTRQRRLAPRKIAGDIPLSITVPVQHDFGHTSLQGELSLGLKLRLITRIHRQTPFYIELQIEDQESASLSASIKGEVNCPGVIQTGERLFRFSGPIPNCPLFRLELVVSPFTQPELNGDLSVGLTYSSKGKTSLIYDNGWRYVVTPRVNTFNPIDVKGKIEGFFWAGMVAFANITTTGHFVSVGVESRIGPKIKGELDLNLVDALSDGNVRLYELLKDSKADFSIRAEADLGFEFRLGNRNSYRQPLLNLIPGIEIPLFEKYLLPTFTMPTTSLSTNKVDVSTEVSRNLLLPCRVGFRLFRGEEVIGTDYHNSTYLDDDQLDAPLSTTFSGLKRGWYTIRPMVQLLGVEMEATPEADFKYGIEVYTGISTPSYTNSLCKGYVKQYDDDGQLINIVPDEYGFFYNTYGGPKDGNANKVNGQLEEGGLFCGKLESLQDNTTYYYTAFARIGEVYFYGDVKTFDTKKFPVKILSFEVDNAFRDEEGFVFDNTQYEFKFECTTIVQLSDEATNVEDWGYVYHDPNGREKKISLKQFGTTYSDNRYAYFRNGQPPFTCTLYGYIKYFDDPETYTDIPHNYNLVYGSEFCNDDNHPHLVDLDLPSGTRWYCTNYGADVPEGWGSYYAYAESNEKKSYMLQNYLYYYDDTQFGGQNSYFENIGANLQNFGTCISGKIGFDVVARNWGNDGRMPTKEEALELVEKCTWNWSFRNGVPGYEVVGPNGNSIFLPASGQKVETTTYQGDPNRLTYYRTGDLSPRQWANQGFGYTWGIRFNQDSYEMSDACAKAFGYVIRPVKSNE